MIKIQYWIIKEESKESIEETKKLEKSKVIKEKAKKNQVVNVEFDESNQDTFFQRSSPPPCEQVETFKRQDSIEEGLASWNFAVSDHYRFEAIKLTKRQTKLLAVFADCPIFGETLKKKLRMEKYIKGWLTKQFNSENKTQVKAYSQIWNQKKIMQAMKAAMGRKGNNNTLYNDN